MSGIAKLFNRTEFPLISVCVPVFNGAHFVSESLDAIAQQGYPNIEILVSVDLGSDESAAICADFSARQDARLWVQRERLGWVRNCNYLLERAQGEFVAIVPHDDLIPPDYFERLYRNFHCIPGAANVYPVIQAFGLSDVAFSQQDIRGDRLARSLDVMLNHHKAVSSLRGLQRRYPSPAINHLCERLPWDRCADTLQIMQHAQVGELRQAPGLVYKKRMHADSTHKPWRSSPLEQRIQVWSALSACMLTVARTFNAPEHHTILYRAALERLLGEAPVQEQLSKKEFGTPTVQVRLKEQFAGDTQRYARYYQEKFGRLSVPFGDT